MKRALPTSSTERREEDEADRGTDRTGSIAGGRPGIAGTGILAASRTAMHTAFNDVKTLEILPKQNLIRVNETLSRNQVYAEEEDFAFVADYIKAHCNHAKVNG